MSGSLQKKGKYYYVVYYVKDENGIYKQKWVSTHCTKKGEAQIVLAEIQCQLHHGTYKDVSNVTFIEFLKDWLENVISREVEQTTLDGYTTNIMVHIIPYFKTMNIKLQDLKPYHLQKYFDEKSKSGRIDGKGGLSGNYLKKHYVNIKKALDYAVSMEIISKNPIDNVPKPKVMSYEARILCREEAVRLMEVSEGTKIEAAIRLAVHYGLRRGEILGLQWSDIDFEKKEMHIRRNRTRVLTPVEKAPKTKSSARKLSIDSSIALYLKRLRARQLEQRLMFGDAYNENDFVCKYEDGTPVTFTTFQTTFKKVLAENDLPNIRIHDLRHSVASFLFQQGFEGKHIQKRLGHSSIKTTMDIYIHLVENSDDALAVGMDNFFAGSN